MLSGQFSRTALGAAGHRAAHQILEGGRIFADPLAFPILGAPPQAILAEASENPARRGLLFFIAARSRIAEEAARQAIEKGARQIVVLGAGLDTFAYRLEGKDGLRVFEVDHPATQAEKRRRLAAAGIATPAHLTFAPCDFEHAELGDSLRAVGFNPNRRAFLLWLGVVPYLTEKAIFATLGFIAKLPGGEVVFDYANPVETIADPAMREHHKVMAERVAAAGEAGWGCFLNTGVGAKNTPPRVSGDRGPRPERNRRAVLPRAGEATSGEWGACGAGENLAETL